MFNFVCVYVIVSACILLGVGVALKKARASGRNVGKVFQPCFEAGIRELPFLKLGVSAHAQRCMYVCTYMQRNHIHNSYADFEYSYSLYSCIVCKHVLTGSPHLIPPVQ